MASHNDFGNEGEAAALAYLVRAGHEILAQNYRYKRAEVDLISKEQGIIVFTEVKTRDNNRYGYPEEFVDKKKMKLMKDAAEEYIYQNKLNCEVRFDIISITRNGNKLDIHHVKDAFLNEEGGDWP